MKGYQHYQFRFPFRVFYNPKFSMEILMFVIGLVFLVSGAEALVRGASNLSAIIGISPLVVGLTIVAFGTSLPELAVSINSALSGQDSISIGNVIGSNIFNVLFILGSSAIVVPLVVSRKLIRFDVPLMIIVSIILLIFSFDKKLSRVDGLILVTGLFIYTWFLIYESRKESAAHQKKFSKEFKTGMLKEKIKWIRIIFLLILGLGLLVLGSKWFIEGAVFVAESIGVSKLVIGLTIVAVGTSIPEVFTSIIAAIHGERDIAVGNVVGSNIFNIMGVLGFASLFSPSGIDFIPAVIGFDLPVMIAVAFACLPIFFTGGIISRQEGIFLIGYYLAYTLYLLLEVSHHDSLPVFNAIMLYFTFPLTAITLVIVVLKEIHKNRKGLS